MSEETTQNATPTDTAVTETPAVDTSVKEAAPTPAPAPQKPQVQIKPAPTPTPAPVVTNTQTPAPAKETPAPANASFDVLLQNLKNKGSLSEKSLIQSLESYLVAMQPGRPITDTEGMQHQYTLWRTIHSVVHQVTHEDFAKHWNLLLAFFAQYQGDNQVFHDRYVFRFSEHWTRDESELQAFQRILNLIKLTSNPNTRKQNLKQVSLNRTLEVGFSEEARQKLLSFYA